ncbi:MAG: SOS response-associated peptidase [Bacteroidota bacterium]
MCYNVAYLERKQQKYEERYKDSLPPDWSQNRLRMELPVHYFVSGFSHPLLPIINHNGIFLFEWGLIPLWTKDALMAKDMQTKTLNAVGETVFEKPSFRSSIVSKRCLLGISGFYEWRDVNKVKYPYFIKTKSNELFSLGCIYETWVDKGTGEIRNTFSILTTPANPMMEKIHNLKKRMPLILSVDDERHWIDPKLSTDDIRKLIKPYPESDMISYAVSKNINSPRNDRDLPESMEKVDYPELD